VKCLSEDPSSKGIMYFFQYVKRLFQNKMIDPKNDSDRIQNTIQNYYFKVDEEKSNFYENELLLRTISFKEKIINDILTPRTKVIAIEVNDSIDEIRDVFLNERYSRIPVFEQDIDHIIGILSEREFLTQLLNNQTVNIRELIRKPIYVIETMKLSTVLTILQKENAHLAIVVDEFGGTSGIVTLEDILEELVGEIRDEFDEIQNDFIQINENEYHFEASISLSIFFNKFKLKIPNSRYLTLGGWLFEIIKHVPKVGETIQYKNITFIINEVQNRRIQSVTVKINNQNLQSKLGS
jgi:CBS domain containing-hemolysin-like protein